MVCLELPKNYQACPGCKTAELGGCVLDLGGESAPGSWRWLPAPHPVLCSGPSQGLRRADPCFLICSSFPCLYPGSVFSPSWLLRPELEYLTKMASFYLTVTQKGSHPDECTLILICSLSANSMMKPDVQGRMNTCSSSVPRYIYYPWF